VTALAYDANGVLWAASDTTPSATGGERLSRWDGSAWTVVLDGSDVAALVPFNGGLAIGGDFASIGSVNANGLAVWDGAAWSPLGLDATSSVTAAAAVPGGLCIAGHVGVAADGVPMRDGVACWDGTHWSSLGDDLRGVSTIALAPDGHWWAGGNFATGVGGVARLDAGTWQIVDGGVQDAGFFPSVDVHAFLFDGDDVIVGGKFVSAGTDQVAAFGLARWSPTTGWSAVRDVRDVQGSGASEGDWRGVHALLRDGDGIVVGGRFATVGNVFAPNIARLDGSLNVQTLTGDRMALGGMADPLTMWRGDLVAAEVRADAVADAPAGVFDGAWHPLPGDPPVVDVFDALAHDDGALTLQSDVIVQWDGTQWTQLADASRPLGPLLLDADDNLYVAVHDPARGATDTTIERWRDGDTESLGVVDFSVRALTVHEGMLVAAGVAWSGDGTTAQPGMAVREDGAWRAIDVLITGAVVDAQDSTALGIVVESSTGQVAVWDGAAWTILADGGVTAIASCDGGAYASFAAGIETGAPVSTLEVNDGTSWQILDADRPGFTTRLLATDKRSGSAVARPGSHRSRAGASRHE